MNALFLHCKMPFSLSLLLALFCCEFSCVCRNETDNTGTEPAERPVQVTSSKMNKTSHILVKTSNWIHSVFMIFEW